MKDHDLFLPMTATPGQQYVEMILRIWKYDYNIFFVQPNVLKFQKKYMYIVMVNEGGSTTTDIM